MNKKYCVNLIWVYEDLISNYYALLDGDKLVIVYKSSKQEKVIKPTLWKEKDIELYHLIERNGSKLSITPKKLRKEILNYVDIIERKIELYQSQLNRYEEEYEEFKGYIE